MDMNALMEAEIRATLAEAMCESMQQSLADCQKECGTLAAQVEHGKMDKVTLAACQAECEDLETKFSASQLKVADLSARLESAHGERSRMDRVFNEVLKRIDAAQQVESTVVSGMEFDIHRGSDGLIRKIVQKG